VHADRLDEHGVGAALLRLTDADASNRIVLGGRLGDAGEGADVSSAEQLLRTRQVASTVADDRTLRRPSAHRGPAEVTEVPTARNTQRR
jgi:hypothetical protein